MELTTFGGFGIWDVPAYTPISAGDWFALFESDPFVSLTLFGFIDLINYALVGLIFLFSAPFRMIWYFLIAVGLFRLARSES